MDNKEQHFFDEGYNAYNAGYSAGDVDYKQGSWERLQWLEGFCAALINEHE